jgi:NAD-dependent dihydropyrimidine dehydrogenase PreA subunit
MTLAVTVVTGHGDTMDAGSPERARLPSPRARAGQIEMETYAPSLRDAHHRASRLVVRTLNAGKILSPETAMAYVITSTCIKDVLCVEVCPTDCIHPKKDEPGFEEATQLYVDPAGCIDCGACVPVCTSDSIHPIDDLPEELKEFAEKNAAYYAN